MSARLASIESIYSSRAKIEERVSPTAFAILPEYFIDKLSAEERESRLIAYRRAFEEARRRAKAPQGAKLQGWFDLFEAGGGI